MSAHDGSFVWRQHCHVEQKWALLFKAMSRCTPVYGGACNAFDFDAKQLLMQFTILSAAAFLQNGFRRRTVPRGFHRHSRFDPTPPSRI